MNKLIVEKDKLSKNIDIIKGLTQASIIAVVKGNGYGLGVLEYSQFLQKNGINLFAVSDLKDAILLSQSGFMGMVLLLTPPCTEEEAGLIVDNNIISSVGSSASASIINDSAAKLNKTAKVHVKIDSGFGRFGFLGDDNLNDISKACDILRALPNIEITGTYTHLSFSFSKKPEHINIQYNKFLKSVELMEHKGINTGMLHICNSSAFLRFPQMHLDAVRIGSAFLGRIPIHNSYGLQKIGCLKSRIIEIRTLPARHNIGYANTYKTQKPTTIAIVPVGYKHGFGLEKSRDTFRFIDILRYIYNDIKLFNKKIYIRINGQLVPILGRISMYHIIVDITTVNAKIGDDVFLDINPLLVAVDVEREYI